MNNELKTISPFKRLCITVGNLPTSYLESMSYYECLTYLLKYLTNDVVPVVNNNSEVVKELQEYVTNYFDNLDVQEEINNKLDEMTEDGTFDEIINQELFGEINDKIDLINSQDTIFLGDSYAAGTTYESGSVQYLTSWCEYLRRLMGLTSGHYYIYAQGNAGFAKIGNNSMNFQMTLNSHLSDITDKNIIKNIIVCAGYNDYDQETTLIYQRIGEFIEFCKTNFPNAQVYIGMIGGDSRDSATGRQVREQLITRVLNAYDRCNQFGGIYLSGVELFTHDFYQFNEQGNHPNEVGYNFVANMIYNAWKNGYATLYEPLTDVSLETNFTPNLNMQSIMLNGTKTLLIDNFIAEGINLTEIMDKIEIVPSNTSNKVVKCTLNGKLQIPVDVFINTGSKEIHAPGRLAIYEDGSINLESTIFAFEHEVVNLAFWPVTTTHSILMS